MKIAITGSSGALGSCVLSYLLEKQHEVFSLDSYLRDSSEEKKTETRLPEKLDWILHFAAKTSIEKSQKDPLLFYQNNIGVTLKALEIAQKSKAAFLFMSSYAYGVPQYLPIDELHPVHAANPYMGSKIICEDLCRQIASFTNMPLVILRGFHVYGLHSIPGRLISDLLELARKRLSLMINDPEPKRDYLYGKDFCSLIEKILLTNPVKTGIYNVGYGKSYSNLEVAHMVRDLVGEKRPVQVMSQRRKADILDCTVNTDLVKKTFNWKPKYSLDKGLKEMISNMKIGKLF